MLTHPDVRRALEDVRAWGLVDAFRLHHDEPGFYSWWDYRMLAFPKNQGLRIDHIDLSEPLAGRWILSGWLAGNPEVVSGVGSRGIVGLGLRTAGQWRFRLQATTGLTDGSEDFTLLFAVSRGVQTPTVGTRGPRR